MSPSAENPRDAAGRITLTYLLFGLLFLLVSEAIITSNTDEQGTPRLFALLLFLASSGTLLSAMVGRELRRRHGIETAEGELRTANEALLAQEHKALLAAEHARRKLALQARAAEVLAPVLDDGDAALSALAGVLVPAFADLALLVAYEDGEERLVGLAHADASVVPALEDLVVGVDWRSVLERLVVPGSPVLIRDCRTDPTEPAIAGLAAAGAVSVAVVPISLDGRPRGAIVAATADGRRGFRPSDVEAIEAVAFRCETALEHVALHRLARDATRLAEEQATRLRV
ncbi:MAG: GAF domain-containing protein, partial [Acidimicrobiia bacterium]|nr:GAF domain-containing protein [Acidimicrobiia bacterium]